MSVSDIATGRGGARKAVDAELNLIPFIDLLSVCVLFLLMTAVWVQISKMSAFSQPSGEATVRHSEVSSITEMREGRDWDVLITTRGVQIKQGGKSLGTFRPETIRETFEKYKSRLGDYKKAKVSVRASDSVVYENVITVLDALFASEITNLTIGGIE